MKRFIFGFILCLMLTSCMDSELEKQLKSVLQGASERYAEKAAEVEHSKGVYPFAYADGQMLAAKDEDAWAGGYFIGSLWMLSQWCEDEPLQEVADVLTYKYREPEGIDLPHLLAVVNVAHRNGYNVTQNARYSTAMGMVSKLMNGNARETYRMMEPVEGDSVSYLRVVINNMPAIETIFDMGWDENVVTHGKNMMPLLCREDGSVAEGLILDGEDKSNPKRFAVYGESVESAWARGQAWALYGYTMLYRTTKDEAFLEQSKKIAAYIKQNLPEDGVPNWDFKSDKKQKDSSAAAIMASAFMDLYALTDDKQYLQVAEQQLTTLCSQEYIAAKDECGGLLLKHGVENYPQQRLVDAALVYGDYYLIEAMIRYLNR